jgi:hypothetical protein
MLKHALFACCLCLLSLLVACGGDGDDPPADPGPSPTAEAQVSGAEAILRGHVQQAFNKEYAGECARADPARDVGKICSVARGERGSLRAFALGQTFSEGVQWVILDERAGQWSVVKVVNITGDNAGVPGVPWPLRTGVDVVVADAPCVNVREGPALNQRAVDCIAAGTTIQLQAGPTTADNIEWWQVTGRSGWIAGDYLRYPDAMQ